MKLDFGTILHDLEAPFVFLAHLIKKPAVQKIFAEIGQEIHDLLPYAVTAVQFVESATPNRAVAELEALLRQVGILEAVDPNLAGNSETYKGLLLRAASAFLHGHLLDAVEQAGEAGLKIGSALVSKTHAVEGAKLDLAVSIAYGFLRSAFGTTLVTETTPVKAA